MNRDDEPLDAADLLSRVRFGADGLVLVAVQSSVDRQVLLVGTMNREALDRTLATGQLWLWSRSRQQLWLKGETSGHFQQVDALYINCELSSLLVQVTSQGPICHTGQPTCFYRQVGGVRREIRPPAEDARAVESSGEQSGVPPAADDTGTGSQPPGADLEHMLHQLYRIYEHLRDADLTWQSTTARLLHAPDVVHLQARLAEELVELAGVADGTHSHAGLPTDAILEASQVCYWTYLLAVGAGLPYGALDPHIHLASNPSTNPLAASRQNRELATVLGRTVPPITTPALQAVLRQVATTCAALGVSPLQVVEYDLAQMRERPYLAALFDAPQGGGTTDHGSGT